MLLGLNWDGSGVPTLSRTDGYKSMWSLAMAQLCDRQLKGKTNQTVLGRQGEHKRRRLQGPKLDSKGAEAEAEDRARVLV